jgi:hypothetical protein
MKGQRYAAKIELQFFTSLLSRMEWASLLPWHIFTYSEFLGVGLAKLLKITAYKNENLMG